MGGIAFGISSKKDEGGNASMFNSSISFSVSLIPFHTDTILSLCNKKPLPHLSWKGLIY